jgi:hypothetical protein
MKTIKFSIVFSIASLLLLSSCGKTYTPEQKAYIASVEQSRAEKDEWMKNDSLSPFNRDSSARFAPLKYFPVDPDFVFRSVLVEFEQMDTVIILGTKGEERKVVKVGYVQWDHKGKKIPINVYKGTSKKGIEYYSIWFTDKTTGKETYSVGRYIDFEFQPNRSFLYTIDFNLAYSPYCSYSDIYSCAIPSKDDHIDMAITAGEKTFRTDTH